MFYILTYCMLLCIMNLKLQKKKGIKKPAMDDADSSDAERYSLNNNCKFNFYT